MTDTPTLTALIEAWAVATCPELSGSSYEFHPSQKSKPLPDIAVEVNDVSTGYTPSDVGLEGPVGGAGWQQAMFRAWIIELMLMVDPTDPGAAETQLKGFSDALQNSVLSDNTLGNTVPWVNRRMKSTFTPPFVQFEDGTRGRLMTMTIVAGEVVPFDD